MRIMYLTQWFDPEPGVIKGPRFVRALEAAGHEVTVVTGFPNYPTGRLYPGYRLQPVMRETVEGARVVRLPLYPSHDASTPRRALNYLSFFLSALAYCLVRRKRYGLAYVYHPPITVGLAAAFAGLVSRLPFVLEVQDLWPDTVAATGMSGGKGLARLLDPICRFVYRRAAGIIVQSEGMRRALLERGVTPEKVTVVRNWADVEIPAPPEPPAEQPGLTVVYGGNFGRAQALSTVVDAAAIIERTRRDIRILLYGDGVDAAALRERVRQAGVTSLELRDRITQAEIVTVFSRADALLLHLARDPLFAITIPSKTQFYLAMGRPVIAGVDGEAAELLQACGAALVAPPENAKALAQAILTLADLPRDQREAMGRAGQNFYRRSLSFEAGLARTLAVIESVHTAASRTASSLRTFGPKL